MATVNRRLQMDGLNIWKFVENPIPQAPPGGAVIKVCYAGVCHSDVHIFHRLYHPKFTFPRVLGHEISGTVHSLGTETSAVRSDLVVGDKVCVFPWGMCQNCANCKADLPYCTTMHYGQGPTGAYVYGIWRDGGYQNYVVVDFVRFLEKVPSNIAMDQAAILVCSGATSYNAIESIQESVNRAIRVNGHAVVGLAGAGALGLWAIQILKAMYATAVKVVAIDISAEKLEDARIAGADFVHKWGTTEGAEEAATCLTSAIGARLDGAIDYIGLPGVIERMHLSLKIGGTLCLVGLSGNQMPDMTLNSVLRRNVSIKGVIVGSHGQCRKLIDLVNMGMVKPPPISHVTLDEVPDTIQRLKDGQQMGRAVVKM